jgi:hypothetical protein
MPIRVWKTESGYAGEVTPPHGNGDVWKSEQAMSLQKLIDALLAQGCHQTDISDALYELDSKWLSKLKKK